jgi:Zn-dependent M16 (insulinase) family peptidase
MNSDFELLRSLNLPNLHCVFEEYRHIKTGAQHIHLAADNDENVFLVALRTLPMDSKGVAHILEHTVLCGSKKYPVRDPFFMMVRRSLNTFMNAFTSSDWTAYPFASQNKKDFNNLLDVYLDAVFFSRLDPLDFAQEGHRLEFSEAENPDSDLVFKGVVYNEMKGAMSPVTAKLWHTLCKYLYPTTTYHYNSGGDPEHIPDLTYDELLDFYRTHYHPGNAIFMTYGNIPASVHQEKFQKQALMHFEPLQQIIQVNNEKRYCAPIAVEEFYPIDSEENIEHKTHHVVGWLLGKTINLDDYLEAQLLSNLLLDNSASPLQNALETSDLGEAPSPLCGLDDSSRELAFVCGLEGCTQQNAEAVEQFILQTLENIKRDGIAQEQIESSLHQLELSQREIGGDHYPYGLQLILQALTAATHRGDPVASMDLDTAMTKLREKVSAPDFVAHLIDKWLLQNKHRVRLSLKPDLQFDEEQKKAEKNRLENIKQQLSDSEKQNIIQRTKDLQARQQQQDDDSILPKVTLADVPAQLHYTAGSHETVNQYPLRRYAAGTNGLVYEQLVMKLPELTEQELIYLPHYCQLLTELGISDLDYLRTQQLQASVVGSLTAFSSIRSLGENVHQCDGYLTLSSKALGRNSQAMNQLMLDTIEKIRFDENERIQELITQQRARREQSITGNGHAMAMAAACAGMSPVARIAQQLSGLDAIAQLKKLDQSLNQITELNAFRNLLQAIHQKVIQAPRQFLLIGDADRLDDYYQNLMATWEPQTTPNNFAAFDYPIATHKINQAWITNTQVNFCAKAYPTVAADHPDAAALTVLGGFLRNGYLHRAIREQGGAYGGGAGQDHQSGAFRFYSYRDPRFEETFADFDQSIEWLLQEKHSEQSLEEAILGVIGSLDKPGSPAGEAKSTFHAELFGRTREKREKARQAILNVTIADLQRVAAVYLKPENASRAVVTQNGLAAQAQKAGFDICTL